MPVRVLVVDDSLICRELLTELLQRSEDIRVVGVARNGKEAIQLNKELDPDLITMDVQMPGMDGFTAVEEIMATKPVPILVVTSSPVHQGVDRTFKALAVGALDLLAKPDLEGDLAETLREKVKLLAGVRVVHRFRRRPQPSREPAAPRSTGTHRTLIAIAASTGGPRVLLEILAGLPRHHACSFLITQHIPDGFCKGFAEWLDGELAMDVRQAADGDRVRPGRVLVAPSGHHLGLQSRQLVKLSDDPPDDNHRPSASFMFRSVAETCGNEAVGIILTGMGRDGARGLTKLHQEGGLCIAQNEASSLVFGMPREAIELNAVDQVLDINQIKQLLLRLGRTS